VVYPSFSTKKPGIPEYDFSGVVAGGDLQGTDLKKGDQVYGIVPTDFVVR
jgi:translation initiation factor 2 gamma subunit (eIF-2gamma)